MLFKKLILLLMSILFLILGVIGLVLPIIPQVPFFVSSLVCVILLSNKLYNKLINSKFYITKVVPYINKHEILLKLSSKINELVWGN